MATNTETCPGGAPPAPFVPDVWRVTSIQAETHDTVTMALEPPAGAAPMQFAPGQFNMMYVFGVGEVPISISGDPHDGPLIHTLRAVGTVTRPLSKVNEGDAIALRGPYGSAWPVAEAERKDVLFLAGGIGLAPLRPALYHILRNRAKYGRVVLAVGARSPEDMIFREELARWQESTDLNTLITVDRADDNWAGRVGVITTLIPDANIDPANSLAMICGPEIMMRFCIPELYRRGMTDEQMYVSMERNMKCAVGFCGHCQYGPKFICKDGPVFRFDQVKWLFTKGEI